MQSCASKQFVLENGARRCTQCDSYYVVVTVGGKEYQQCVSQCPAHSLGLECVDLCANYVASDGIACVDSCG